MNDFRAIADDVILGKNVYLSRFVNLYGCTIGNESKIGAFVEIQKGASVGSHCKISSHSFLCEGVTIEDNVFIGHGVQFTNDTYPRATAPNGNMQTEADWKVEPTIVRKGASIGTGATILCNISIGENAIVGAGSVVTRDVPQNAVVAGNPARVLRYLEPQGEEHTPQPVPFLDLITPHRELENELVGVFLQALHTAGFVGGEPVTKFERAFAQYCGVPHAVGVGSGTDALRFALLAAGVGAGEVAVTVPNTFIATSEAISQTGAMPEFVDVDADTGNLSVDKLRFYLEELCERNATGRLISKRSGRLVTALVPVHLYGRMADMDGILALAREYDLKVIEDACQAHGAEYYSQQNHCWMKAGSMGDAAAFSFYPGKNLGACGEGGAVTTKDPALAAKVCQLREHGQSRKYIHETEGYNGRLDAIQAGILRVKLAHLDAWNAARRERAAEYDRSFAGCETVKPMIEPAWSRTIYHLYVVRTPDRTGMIEFLKQKSIGTGIHYPIPLHLQTAYAALGYVRGSFPVAERLAAEVLSLPMYPQMHPAQQSRVIAEVLDFAARASAVSMD